MIPERGDIRPGFSKTNETFARQIMGGDMTKLQINGLPFEKAH